MSVSSASFKKWAKDAGLPEGAGRLATSIEVGRATLQAQFLRGHVPEWVVVKAARAAGRPPVDVLSVFDEYSDLVAGVRPPKVEEVLSQITMDDALLELLQRRRPGEAKVLSRLQDWPAPPLQDGLRQWIDAVDPGDLRRKLGDILDIAPSNLSAQITANNVSPFGLVAAARIAGSSSVSGLAVAGLITLEEAHWPHDARQNALAGLRDSELHDLVSARIAAAQRGARRQENDQRAADKIQDVLG